MVYYAISDPEGYDLLTLSDYKPSDINNKLIISGDVLDSTFVGNILKYPDAINAKSYNLRNIKNVLCNKNIKLVFGNRDLNKIKCKFLCELENPNNDENITNFNNGDIKLDIDIYKLLLEKINNSIPWKIENLNSWYTFWGDKLGDLNKDLTKKQPKQWHEKMDYSTDPFFKRFEEIFGADTAIGTMSAGNLLYTIPNELDLYYDNKDNQDYLAFIVLAVFKSMLIKTEIQDVDLCKNIEIKSIRNSNLFKGWLYNLYSSQQALHIEGDSTNIYLFSHGGITKELIQNPEILDSYLDLYNKNRELYNILIDGNTIEYSVKLEQKGGYYSNNLENINIDVIQLKKIVDDINNKIKTNINRVFDIKTEDLINIKNNDKYNDILFLLIMTANFNCSKLIKKLKEDKGVTCTIDKIDINSRLHSPILPGLLELRNHIFGIKGVNINQIIGHVPFGYSSTIDYFENKTEKNKTMIINVDISNSFLGTDENSLNVNTNRSKSYIIINLNTNKIITFAELYLNKNPTIYNNQKINDNIKGINNFYISNKLDNKLLKKEGPLHILKFNHTVDYKFLNLIKNSYGNIYLDEKKEIYNYINVHSYLDKYYIFTHMNNESQFNKILYILNKKDFFNFHKINNTSNIKNKYDDNLYHDKYIKYKNKYLKLKYNL